MHAPEWICEKLFQLHPFARFGWQGLERDSSDELNKGNFALIQLYHSRDAAETFYGAPWGEGPIFGRSFDPMERRPICLHLWDDPMDVFSGKCLEDIKKWMKPIKNRVLDNRVECGKEYQSALDDQAEAQGEHMFWKANKANAPRPPIVAKKFLTQADKDMLSGASIKGVKDTFVDNLPKSEPMK